MGLFCIMKEADMWESGNKIKWKEKAFSIIQTIPLHIKVTGKMISFTDLVLYIMKKRRS